MVGGRETSVIRMLAMALDDPLMDADVRQVLATHETVIGNEWADVE
ncbi:MAG: hypothetical protein ABSG53_06690 [Thermoguttaceae bacterium]|jgi:hypothetical protein